MASKTYAAYGDSTNMIQQAVGVFAQNLRRNTNLRRLTGAMPKGLAGASATIRQQSSNTMPIVQVQDLGKGKGEEATFHLIQPSSAKPIMGSEVAEGRGTGISLVEDRLRVNQARFPINLGDAMTSIRSPVEFRKLGRPIAQDYMDRYMDQGLLTQLAGARGFHTGIDWIVPTTADSDFSKIMINTVKAPTRNRHFIADSGSLQSFYSAASSGTLDVATTDLMKMDVVDAARAMLEQLELPPPPVIFEGDEAAMDSPLRVMMVSPAQYSSFATDSTFRTFQASALARASQAGQNPLFKGEAGLWNGILIVKMPKPIRFYAGDAIKYCASYTSEDESSIVVPSGFGTTYAIDRALILGGQSLVQAFASAGEEKGGIPFFWSEKELDHGDKVELLIGAIWGASKIRFDINTASGNQYTDYGVIALDTAVPITSARN